MEGYWVDADLHPCRLSCDDLAELLRVIERGFPQPDAASGLEIRSYLPHIVVQGCTLEEYLANEGLPDRVTRLEIRRVHRDAALEVDQTVELTFLPILVKLHVQGPDKRWVLAAHREIRAFLAARRPWYWPLVGRWAWLGLLLWAFLACVMLAAGRSQALLALGTGVGLLGLELAALLDTKDQLLPCTEIVIHKRKAQLQWKHLAAALSLAGLVMLIADWVVTPPLG